MKFTVQTAIAALAAVAISTAAFAEADAIKSRQTAMKAVGGAMGDTLVKMIKGEIPYDSAKASAALAVMSASAKGFDDLFPKGSETGGEPGHETAATPKIWSDTAGFKTALNTLKTTIKAQEAAVATDLDGVKAAVNELGKACKGCHDTYRVKKS